jgi:hypothetical protein
VTLDNEARHRTQESDGEEQLAQRELKPAAFAFRQFDLEDFGFEHALVTRLCG